MIEREDFERFYHDSLPRFAAFARRLAGSQALAEDIVQESYYRLLRGRFESPRDEDRRRYLYRIAINLMKSRWREPRHESLQNVIEKGEKDGALPTRVDVTRVLMRLTPRDRSLLLLAYGEGQSHREIASVLGVGVLSVRVLLSRARKRFVRLMEGKG